MEDESTSRTSSRPLDTPVSIAIEGEINDTTLSEVRDALQTVRDAHQTTLLIEIASDGGSVYACLAIIDLLRAWLAEDNQHTLTTFATHAFSAAVNIFSLGSVRVASPLSTFMNHCVSGGLEGEVTKMKQQLEEADRVNKLCDAELAKTIGDEATAMLCSNGEKYIDAPKALEIGLATHVGHVRARVDVSLSINSVTIPPAAERPPARKRARRGTAVR